MRSQLARRAVLSILVTALATSSACLNVAGVVRHELDDRKSPGLSSHLAETLEADEGLLLLEVDSNTPIHGIAIRETSRLGHRIEIDDLPKGRRSWVVPLQRGRYRLERVEIMGYPYRNKMLPFTWDFESESHWEFEVAEGRLNYPGVLVLAADRRSKFLMALTSFTLNRSGQLAKHIQERAPWIFDQYPPQYTGRGRDDFLEVFASWVVSRSASIADSTEGETAGR